MPVATSDISDTVRSLGWAAAIERTAASLPAARGVARLRRRHFFHDERVAFSALLDPAAVPSRGLFVDQLTGASVLVGTAAPTVRSAAAADVVMVGAMRAAGQLRFRAFYLSDAARTLAVQQRLVPDVPTPLVAGIEHQRGLVGRTPFAVPRILEHGHAGTGLGGQAVADWVVEETLDGVPIGPADAERTVAELLELLAETWQRLGVTHEGLDGDERENALTAFASLVDDPPLGAWPDGLDPHRTWSRVRSALEDTRPLTTGLSHGDAGVGNVLRLADGRLALVDWEFAGYRAVAHDVVKVLKSAPDPLALAAVAEAPPSLRPALTAAGAVPWRQQLAVALVLFLSGWRNRHLRAVARGSVKANNRRMRMMLAMLDDLLP
ncbi:aminoglycoside phosphotransferase family protein [Jiangella anatolica]|uniref:Aminoglycoside phosphotransferase domain-containing protein n=1 Tax=Jiangella anatolica TaxID=2670374 RepID=A0A2W2AZL1_9ACTN|nr:aminoglycoside phosphotransferase family protein [Jiangella anatolica]PZF80571.1 hypothetical protein C1I92_25420 [Jiangella anatolica]